MTSLALLAVGCSRRETPSPGSASRAEEAAAPLVATTADAGGSASASASSSAPPPRRFPPSPIRPPVTAAAQPGDGDWTPMPVQGLEPPAAFRTVLHPLQSNKAVAVYLVAFDFTRVELHLLPGTKEPINPTIPSGERAGVMRREDATRLIATTNGGWLSAHGRHGMRVGKDLFVPPLEAACTMALTDTGAIRIGTWSRIKGEDAHFAWWRQNVPCLIEDGQPNPEAAIYDRRKWGSSEKGEKDVRRSAYAISKDGQTLYFAIGHLVDPELFATTLADVGVEAASQFDINYAFTRFLFFDHKNEKGEPVGTSPLMKDMTTTPREGWATPAARDLFYLVLRPAP